MSAQPCIECHRRPPAGNRRRCLTCQLRNEPIGTQVEAARRRLAAVPEELRVKRSKKILALAPAGTSFCAGCQSFRDLEDFGKKATTCRACSSARAHGAMIAKTYGLTPDAYDALLALQGGRCAICRARPRSKRLAVDHDHGDGAVRGLLCSRCNHDLMGSAWDSLAIVAALWHYLNTPPASGAWLPPEKAPAIGILDDAQRPAKPSDEPTLVTIHGGGKRSQSASVASAVDDSCQEMHFIPLGAERVEGKPGIWRYYAELGEQTVAPF